MHRKCEKIIIGSKKSIYIDSLNKKEILNYLNKDKRHKTKFRFISEILISGLYNSKVYRREDINNNCKDVYAMRFFVNQENDRIYCKELNSKDGIRIVIMAILHESKKAQKLSSKEISKIEKIGGYIYEV